MRVKAELLSDCGMNQLDTTTLVDEHGDYLFAYTRKYFSERELAEDLVQETFLAAVKNRNSFRGDSSPRTWLVSILRNKIMDELRARMRDKNLPAFSEEAALDYQVYFGERDGYEDEWTIERSPRSWKASPEIVCEQSEFLRAMKKCLHNLADRPRQVFLLREMEDRPLPEIASALGLTEANVRVVLHRARILLRDCIEFSWIKAI